MMEAKMLIENGLFSISSQMLTVVRYDALFLTNRKNSHELREGSDPFACQRST